MDTGFVMAIVAGILLFGFPLAMIIMSLFFAIVAIIEGGPKK